MHNFIDFLKSRINLPLPGKNAQLKMAPKPANGGPGRKMDAPSDAHKSCVLILLFPNDKGELELILTLRNSDIDHGGQISLPGGRANPEETETETALREAQEEVGLQTGQVQILGTLSDLYVNHSNNRVTPVVGFVNFIPDLKRNPSEVEEIFTVELKSLATKKNLIRENWELMKNTYEVPFWDVHRVPLWGATAMILSEFLELYREFQSKQ